MCKCGHFTVNQPFDLIFVSLKSRTDSIVQHPAVHVLFLCFRMQTQPKPPDSSTHGDNTANDNNSPSHFFPTLKWNSNVWLFPLLNSNIRGKWNAP